jgi:hypothetical protein
MDRLDYAADYTIEVTRRNYPDLRIPWHARHEHFRCGNVDRPALLATQMRPAGADLILRAMIDLVVVSVLLDAGTGPQWVYRDAAGRAYSRSEGLAVASFDMFMAGAFSSDRGKPLCADIGGLRRLSIGDFERGLQVSDVNPLTGVAGRVGVLNRLGEVMERRPDVFPNGRPADLLRHVLRGSTVSAPDILRSILLELSPIWPARLALGGRNAGDVWRYRPLGEGVDGLVPFHKLSQWLTYSLMVPLADYGYAVGNISELTGLAEYRNGGLMIDAGLLELRDQSLQERAHAIDSELVVEWRALTVALLDLLADRMRHRLGLNHSRLPLAAVLQGGTWHAGRKIAIEKRPDGAPPLRVASDGTVF